MSDNKARFTYTDIPDIGKVLKALREDADLSQIKVMQLTGINNKTLSGYENNVSEPDLRTLATLIHLYGTSADYILNPQSELVALTKAERKLLVKYRMLQPQVKDALAAQIKALVKEGES